VVTVRPAGGPPTATSSGSGVEGAAELAGAPRLVEVAGAGIGGVVTFGAVEDLVGVGVGVRFVGVAFGAAVAGFIGPAVSGAAARVFGAVVGMVAGESAGEVPAPATLVLGTVEAAVTPAGELGEVAVPAVPAVSTPAGLRVAMGVGVGNIEVGGAGTVLAPAVVDADGVDTAATSWPIPKLLSAVAYPMYPPATTSTVAPAIAAAQDGTPAILRGW
jgi:hypothetical protein